MLTCEAVAQMIDHSILHPAVTEDALAQGIAMCRERGVGQLVPKIYQVPAARRLLGDCAVRLLAPIGFPQGLNPPQIKRAEAQWALEQGAVELDMVINVTALKSGDDALVAEDIRGVVDAAQPFGAPVKVILETCLLTDEEKVRGCRIAEGEGARFVKTSTQTQPGGATVEDVRLLRANLHPDVIVKASGYITDIDKLLALYEAGARRFGTGYTVQILDGLAERRKQAGLLP
ncbi:MAG: deoxyribose-phosphate aldolase [Anaerolineae bacterium]|jgi:deoxyribose-phosphate aldolase|nr:deoxyribose-phosphate aldolase [Chloroflexota bacterium]